MKISTVNIYLLDGVGAGILLLFFGLGLVFIIAIILLEAWIMQKMKYHAVYKQALLQSLVANLATLGAGFIMIDSGLEIFEMEKPIGFAGLFAATLVLETLILWLMNRKMPFKKTLAVSVVMNLASYLIAFILLATA